MEAIRHIITPRTKNLEITIPDNLIDEELEIIILQVNEFDKKQDVKPYQSLRGKLSKTAIEQLLKHVEDSRNS